MTDKHTTNEELTRIYNEANGVTTKHPPISTERIFNAMRAAREIGRNAGLEEAAQEFDKRDNGIGFYDPHEPAEIVRSFKR